jgi:hypothetical protein
VINDECQERANQTTKEERQGKQNLCPVWHTPSHNPQVWSEHVQTLLQRNSGNHWLPEVQLGRLRTE